MKRFICTGDIHVSIKKDIPEQWQVNRYHLLFTQLAQDCVREEADLIIAGDLLDKAAPTLQELQLVFTFFKVLEDAGVLTYLISGNHETISSGKCTFSYLKDILPGNVSLMSGKTLGIEEDCELHFMSHCDLNFDQGAATDKTQILVTHFRTGVSTYILEELDTEKLCAPYDLVIAGDIHSNYEKGKLVYTNQPINSCFETKPDTGGLLLELDQGLASYRRIKTNLPSLVQVNCESVEDLDKCIFNTTDFYRVSVTGSLKELRAAKVNLPNVKLDRLPRISDLVEDYSESESACEEMALDMQLVEYLKKVPYSEDNIQKMLDIWKEVV